jgi:cbb3-type cytochrome oxidase cytochrome c subunit
MEQRLNYLVAATFIALIFLTIIFVTAILPITTFQPIASDASVTYTAQQLRGRDIYRREGCFYCHSQFSRFQDRNEGELVSAGDYVKETPHLLGTERTGPDLSNIGAKYPDAWHVAHHMYPRSVKPGSLMPSYSYLTTEEMDDLVAYLQTVGSKRQSPRWITPPQEIRDRWHEISKKVDVNSYAIANSGRGIYMQNCAQCHGVTGRGNGPVSDSMHKKPANLTRPYFAAYTDSMYYWRIAEGVAGTRMPRWNKTLSEEDMAYLVAFIKTLPSKMDAAGGKFEVTNTHQLDPFAKMQGNYYEIETLKKGHEENAYVYGGGRP